MRALGTAPSRPVPTEQFTSPVRRAPFANRINRLLKTGDWLRVRLGPSKNSEKSNCREESAQGGSPLLQQAAGLLPASSLTSCRFDVAKFRCLRVPSSRRRVTCRVKSSHVRAIATSPDFVAAFKLIAPRLVTPAGRAVPDANPPQVDSARPVFLPRSFTHSMTYVAI